MYRVAAIQMTSGCEIKENLAIAATWIAQAADQGAKWVVLPEMFAMMGLDQIDKVKIREKLGQGMIQDFLREQAVRHKIWLTGGTLPLAVDNNDEKVHAACLLYDDQGNITARYDKVHLFDVSLQATQESYFESKTTAPGKNAIVAATPVGKVGLAVCYDVRFPELFRSMHEKGVELVALPAAFTQTTGAAHWDILVRARAIENQVYVVAAAQTGTHPGGRKTYGHSMIVDPWGIVIATLADECGIIVADIDLDYLRNLRRSFPVLEHKILK